VLMNPTQTKPTLALNLAATYTKDMGLVYPKYGSAKFDGIRMVVIDGMSYSRNMILIPNLNVQKYFADGKCDGMDGELLSGKHDTDVFKRTSSVIRSIDGSNEWHFKVFDLVGSTKNFAGRLQELRERMVVLQDEQKFKVSLVPQKLILDDDELAIFEDACLQDGFEGAMLRNPNAMYKHGRATANSQDLLKVKRFEDSEAVVLGWSPLIDSKTGLERPDVMGSLQVRDVYSGIEFSIGSGFDAVERTFYAMNPPVGQYLTYQFFGQGAYVKPRFPTFKGFRTDIDMSKAAFK
jgi:DNA ligase 1